MTKTFLRRPLLVALLSLAAACGNTSSSVQEGTDASDGALDDGALDDGALDDGALDDGALDGGALDGDGALNDGALDGGLNDGGLIGNDSGDGAGIDGSDGSGTGDVAMPDGDLDASREPCLARQIVCDSSNACTPETTRPTGRAAGCAARQSCLNGGCV
ncbi:MAG: hypothetical protein IPN17_24890, partial [Deltaproteobacteria bacterium]|nr:hypothetical protein [Deltaproteobacteria bacterium]